MVSRRTSPISGEACVIGGAESAHPIEKLIGLYWLANKEGRLSGLLLHSLHTTVTDRRPWNGLLSNCMRVSTPSSRFLRWTLRVCSTWYLPSATRTRIWADSSSCLHSAAHLLWQSARVKARIVTIFITQATDVVNKFIDFERFFYQWQGELISLSASGWSGTLPSCDTLSKTVIGIHRMDTDFVDRAIVEHRPITHNSYLGSADSRASLSATFSALIWVYLLSIW